MSFSPGLEGSWVLNNATGFRKIYIAAGYTDLRRGIDGLASIIKFNFQLDPYEKDILFLFCGRRSDRIKGLVWEGWIPSPLQKAGDRLQTPDPGSASSGSPVKHCAKRRKSKIFSHSPSRAD